MLKPTHKCTFYGISVFMDDRTGAVWGCNWFCDLLLYPAVLFHWFCTMLNPHYCEDGFPFVIIEEYPDEK